jgi:hypothetical protein
MDQFEFSGVNAEDYCDANESKGVGSVLKGLGLSALRGAWRKGKLARKERANEGYYVHNDDDWPEQVCGVVTAAEMAIVIRSMSRETFRTAVIEDLRATEIPKG